MDTYVNYPASLACLYEPVWKYESEEETRFIEMDEMDLDQFIDGQKNIDTTRNANSHMKLLQLFMKTKHEYRLHFMPEGSDSA